MKESRFQYFTYTSLGLSLGLFLSFLVSVLLFENKVFEKPWDIIWSGLFGVIGALIGSFVGGVIAYKIAKIQLTEQVRENVEKVNQEQRILATLILEELEINKSQIVDLIDLIPSDNVTCDEIACAVVEDGADDLIQGILIIFNRIETEYLLQTRISLHDLKYIKLHKCIQMLSTIQKQGQKLSELKDRELIKITFISVRKKCVEFIELYTSLSDIRNETITK